MGTEANLFLLFHRHRSTLPPSHPPLSLAETRYQTSETGGMQVDSVLDIFEDVQQYAQKITVTAENSTFYL